MSKDSYYALTTQLPKVTRPVQMCQVPGCVGPVVWKYLNRSGTYTELCTDHDDRTPPKVR